MKKFTICTALVLFSLLLAACGASQEFTSDAGKFSVSIATPLTEKVQSVDTTAGKIDMHMFTGNVGKITYMVSYSDYPPDVVKKDPQQVLDLAENGAVTNVNGVFLSSKKITLDGNPGYEFLMESTDTTNNITLTTKAHFFMVGDRLYQVLALANKGDADFTAIDKFLGSFKVLK